MRCIYAGLATICVMIATDNKYPTGYYLGFYFALVTLAPNDKSK